MVLLGVEFAFDLIDWYLVPESVSTWFRANSGQAAPLWKQLALSTAYLVVMYFLYEWFWWPEEGLSRSGRARESRNFASPPLMTSPRHRACINFSNMNEKKAVA